MSVCVTIRFDYRRCRNTRHLGHLFPLPRYPFFPRLPRRRVNRLTDVDHARKLDRLGSFAPRTIADVFTRLQTQTQIRRNFCNADNLEECRPTELFRELTKVAFRGLLVTRHPLDIVQIRAR